jgi:hypothetical protein
MAQTLETIVRPFQTPAIGTPVADPNQVGVPPVILSFGRSGRGKQFQGSFNETITFYMTKYVNETKNS